MEETEQEEFELLFYYYIHKYFPIPYCNKTKEQEEEELYRQFHGGSEYQYLPNYLELYWSHLLKPCHQERAMIMNKNRNVTK
jgi:hypothetical protein